MLVNIPYMEHMGYSINNMTVDIELNHQKTIFCQWVMDLMEALQSSFVMIYQ